MGIMCERCRKVYFIATSRAIKPSEFATGMYRLTCNPRVANSGSLGRTAFDHTVCRKMCSEVGTQRKASTNSSKSQSNRPRQAGTQPRSDRNETSSHSPSGTEVSCRRM
jgi:hypothetical protein